MLKEMSVEKVEPVVLILSLISEKFDPVTVEKEEIESCRVDKLLPDTVDKLAATVLRPTRKVLVSWPTAVDKVEIADPRFDKLLKVRTDKLLATVDRPSCKTDKLLKLVVDKLIPA
jgi:hypothetical protein